MIMGIGWASVIIASLTLIYQVCGYIFQPARYCASVFISFNLTAPGGTEARDAIDTKKTFLCSRKILLPVIYDLKLTQKWGAKLFESDYVLKSDDAYYVLLSRMDVYPLKNPQDVVELDVFSDDRKEATAIADSIALYCRDYFQKKDSPPPISLKAPPEARMAKLSMVSWLIPWCISMHFIGLGIFLIFWGRRFPRVFPPPEEPLARFIAGY